ncbi:MAG: hypothetical protein IJZ80_01150 [Clostridia bacterium]|nr:hypothetical protein [Clostridia bacterium]
MNIDTFLSIEKCAFPRNPTDALQHAKAIKNRSKACKRDPAQQSHKAALLGLCI